MSFGMFPRRPSLCSLFLILLVLAVLLVTLYNDGAAHNRHGSASDNGLNSRVLNIQQKVLSKFEQGPYKGRKQSNDKPSRTMVESNSSEDSYLPSSSDFSDAEVKERPSDLTGDNAREVRVSSDDNPRESEGHRDRVQEDGPANVQEKSQSGAKIDAQKGSSEVANNHARVLKSHTKMQKLEELEPKQEINKSVRPMDYGKKRTFLHEWNEFDDSAWKTLPLVASQNDKEKQKGVAVIYNRVGKCGSRSVLGVLRSLALKNHWHLVSSQVFNRTRISSTYEAKLVSTLNQVQRPYLYQRHLYFVDFRRYGAAQPKYINIIRDPLSRMVSQYYFQRFGDGKSEDRNYQGDAMHQTFDECVLQNKVECYGPRTFYIVPYFCGQDSRCREKTMWAVEEAIRNVKDNYVAVGLLEELEDTLKVFEKLVPEFFDGVLDIYKTSVLGEARNNITAMTTKHKVPPSPEVIKKMKSILKLEYIFYDFIKTRFHMQKRELGIS
nr:uronyl 2-sulfotransferase-like [Lytechinus pictus]